MVMKKKRRNKRIALKERKIRRKFRRKKAKEVAIAFLGPAAATGAVAGTTIVKGFPPGAAAFGIVPAGVLTGVTIGKIEAGEIRKLRKQELQEILKARKGVKIKRLRGRMKRRPTKIGLRPTKFKGRKVRRVRVRRMKKRR